MKVNGPFTDMEVVAEALALLDGRSLLFRGCRANPVLERLSGAYGEYLHKAAALIARIDQHDRRVVTYRNTKA